MNELTVRSGFNAEWVCHKFVRVNRFSEFWDCWIVEKGFGNCCFSGALSLPSVIVVQSLSHTRIFVTWWTVACQASLSFTISQHLLKLMSIESVMPSNHLILYHPLLLLPSIFPSIRVFSNESALCIQGPKYWSFSFNLSPSNGNPRPISRMDWLDLLAIQGTLNSLLQHHNLKASVPWYSDFFMVQL